MSFKEAAEKLQYRLGMRDLITDPRGAAAGLWSSLL
jgi:hypothetical protein